MPVAAKAKQADLIALKHSQPPRWKNLGEEPGDQTGVPKDELRITNLIYWWNQIPIGSYDTNLIFQEAVWILLWYTGSLRLS